MLFALGVSDSGVPGPEPQHHRGGALQKTRKPQETTSSQRKIK